MLKKFNAKKASKAEAKKQVPIKKRKRNWEVLSERTNNDTLQFRDVYEDQQLERSSIEEKLSPTSRKIIAAIVALLMMVIAWGLIGMMQYGIHKINPGNQGSSITQSQNQDVDQKMHYEAKDPYNYIGETTDFAKDSQGNPIMVNKYYQKDETGKQIGGLYDKAEDVPEPEWYAAGRSQYEKQMKDPEFRKKQIQSEKEESLSYWVVRPTLIKFLFVPLIGLLVFSIIYKILLRNLAAQNLMRDTTDINQYHGDQHIALPEEVQAKFSFFPDAGAHSNVQVSSMISHMAVQNKGIKKIDQSVRAKEDILDEDGDVEYLKDEVLYDSTGNAIVEKKPMFDTDFMEALFDASGLPKDKNLRKYFDPTQVPYNPGNKNRDKLKDYDTLADLVNGDWILPAYEKQRPAGAYIVDTDPVNTMVLAITRAGKGQTIINPTIDMWTRERKPNNMVINDPKGELLQSFYVAGTYRNFQIVQFNLINSMNTDIYNPLLMAANAAREGDFTKTAMYVTNIAEVFFPVDGGDDPVWPNAFDFFSLLWYNHIIKTCMKGWFIIWERQKLLYQHL